MSASRLTTSTGPAKRLSIFLETDVVIDADPRLGIDLDHDVDVAIGPVVAARHRAEQSGAAHAARPQRRFRSAQNGKSFITIHSL